MKKRRKVINFHSWLNRAMVGVFLGCLRLFVSVIPLSKLLSLERVHESAREWAEKNGRGERAQISTLPRGFPEASWRLPGLSYTVWPQQRKWQCVMI